MKRLLLIAPVVALLATTRAVNRHRVLVTTPGRGAATSQSADTAFTPDVLALGEKIFQGKAAGGLCFSCHLPNAKGQKGIAPNLTDNTWTHGDGSYGFIVSTVESGVPKPKEAAAPMPPMGGAKLTPDQVKAVAAYVWSLRRRK